MQLMEVKEMKLMHEYYYFGGVFFVIRKTGFCIYFPLEQAIDYYIIFILYLQITNNQNL